jgi:hypothetical protein
VEKVRPSAKLRTNNGGPIPLAALIKSFMARIATGKGPKRRKNPQNSPIFAKDDRFLIG